MRGGTGRNSSVRLRSFLAPPPFALSFFEKALPTDPTNLSFSSLPLWCAFGTVATHAWVNPEFMMEGCWVGMMVSE